MSYFQLALFIVASAIFVIFFKKLISGNYPKRGVDYEAKLPNKNIGGITEPTKTFSKPDEVFDSRVEEFLAKSDRAFDAKEYQDALQFTRNAYILDSKNIEIVKRFAKIFFALGNYGDAKIYCEKILSIQNDDKEAQEILEQINQKGE